MVLKVSYKATQNGKRSNKDVRSGHRTWDLLHKGSTLTNCAILASITNHLHTLGSQNTPATGDITAYLCSFGGYNFKAKEKMYGRTGIIKAPLPSVVVNSLSA